MPRRVQITINLLPKDPFFDTFIGKILRWALSVGRYIVIFTELIVIMSFAARFNLDRQVTDLNDSLNQKLTIIESFGELEENIRQVQTKVDSYRQISQQTIPTEAFTKLSALTPADITLTSLNIQAGKVQLEGTALSSNSLNVFINNLQLSPDFSSISVDELETGDKRDPGFRFKISASLAGELAPQAPTAESPTKQTSATK